MKKILSTCTPTILAILILTISSCTKYQIPGNQGPEPDVINDVITSSCDPDTVYFLNTVLPLVVSSCATTGCHEEKSHRDGIILTDYSSIIRTGEIKPGDPNDSEFFESLTDDDDMVALAENGSLMGSIRWESSYARMPTNQQLSECNISLLQKWIDEGFPQ